MMRFSLKSVMSTVFGCATDGADACVSVSTLGPVDWRWLNQYPPAASSATTITESKADKPHLLSAGAAGAAGAGAGVSTGV